MQVLAMRSIKSEQVSLFTITASLKYKFVLCLLKEDWLNRSVSAYHDDIIKYFNT